MFIDSIYPTTVIIEDNSYQIYNDLNKWYKKPTLEQNLDFLETLDE